MKKSITIILISILWISSLTQAAEFHVTTGKELLSALSTAQDNGQDDTILLGVGIYKGEFKFTTSEANALTISAEHGLTPEQVVLDGGGIARVLYLDAKGIDTDFVVKGITLQNGNIPTYFGGGLYLITNGNIYIYNNIVTGNSSLLEGGGICVSTYTKGVITISNNKINGNSCSDFSAGGLYVYSASTGTISFDNNTLSGNSSSKKGSALYLCVISNSMGISLNNNSIIGNHSPEGGALFVNIEDSDATGSISFNNNTIIGNSSYSDDSKSSAGGLYILSMSTGMINFNSNTIIGNSSSYIGGGLYVDSKSTGIINISNNNITENSSKLNAGGIFAKSKSNIIITKNIITKNSSQSNNRSAVGGGIYIHNAISTTLINNIITENQSKYTSGGGIFIKSSDTITMINNTISKNTALNGAGMYLTPNQSLYMCNNTISNNTGQSEGGGIYINASDTQENIYLYNNIVWGNTFNGNSNDIYLYGFGGTKYLYNNNFQQITGEWENKSDNIDVSPLFFSPETNDYHLQPTSKCINAGTATALELTTTTAAAITDQDGNERIGIIDIGAYEYNTKAMHPADTNKDWSIDESEFSTYNNSWRNRINWDNKLIPIDYMTRAGFIIESGETYHNNGAGRPTCWTPGKSN